MRRTCTRSRSGQRGVVVFSQAEMSQGSELCFLQTDVAYGPALAGQRVQQGTVGRAGGCTWCTRHLGGAGGPRRAGGARRCRPQPQRSEEPGLSSRVLALGWRFVG